MGDNPPARDEEVRVLAGSACLTGHLTVPKDLKGMVVFAHGSGSSRLSPRNRFVANILNEAGLATLLFDLLTNEEELGRAHVFDIPLLAVRLAEVTRWVRTQTEVADANVGYFGASTGAAAALWAAAQPDTEIYAVVSRGGRPDLVTPMVEKARAPTLLIVGGYDETVLELNRQTQQHLHCENRLAVVPGATHLFVEPGALEAVATLARDWFLHFLYSASHPLQ